MTRQKKNELKTNSEEQRLIWNKEIYKMIYVRKTRERKASQEEMINTR